MMKKIHNLLKNLIILGAIIINSPLWGQNGLSFDGTDDRVTCGNDTSVQITGKFLTLEAWIYPTSFKTNAYEGNVICKIGRAHV